MVTTDAAAARYEKGQLYQIPLTDLQADPNQPRKFMDPQALEDLAASIAQHGVLTPILFRVAPATAQSSALSTQNLLLIVAGERRCEAAKKAGLTGGKTGATPYFLFSENRELYRLFRATPPRSPSSRTCCARTSPPSRRPRPSTA